MTRIGRYEIREELGKGGMASVYRAHDPRFDRDVALKTLPPELLHDPTFRARFELEARTIAALEHPGIVPVYDFGEEDGQPYLVMRLMTGGSLDERIHSGPLPLAEIARILARLAPALDYAHQKGVIHRDIKPANILFDQHNEPYLSDFGIARLTESTASLTGRAIVGTPAYMSPEQGRGEADIDGATDIYALGAILFEMLTGRVPYDASTPTGQIIRHITDPIPEVASLRGGLPKGTQAVIARAMAKRKYARHPTAAGLAADVTALAEGREVRLARPNQTVSLPAAAVQVPRREAKAAPHPPRRFRLPAWSGWLAGGLALLGLLAFIFWPYPQTGSPSVTPSAAALLPTSAPTQGPATLPVLNPTAAPSDTPVPPAPPPQPTPAAWALVESFSGQPAQISGLDQNPGAAGQGALILPGQDVTIATDSGSLLKLRLSDGTLVYIHQDTRLRLPSIAGGDGAETVLVLEAGHVLVAAQNALVKIGAEYTAAVSDGVMGVSHLPDQPKIVVDCLEGSCFYGDLPLAGGGMAGAFGEELLGGAADYSIWQELLAFLGEYDAFPPTPTAEPSPTTVLTNTPWPTNTPVILRPTFTPTKKPKGGGGGGGADATATLSPP